MQAAGAEFVKVSGRTEIMGSGGLIYQYVVYVQKGHHLKPGQVAERIDATLGDKRGWIRSGKVRFQRVGDAAEADTTVYVAAPEQVDQLCAPLDTAGEVSCCIGTRVVFNIKRWKVGVAHWTGSVRSYREMVINHEFGHRIGHHHDYCTAPGKRAPVMQQQTYGLQGCKENSWSLDSELS
jgi:Protein of unknown function (DUF3152)